MEGHKRSSLKHKTGWKTTPLRMANTYRDWPAGKEGEEIQEVLSRLGIMQIDSPALIQIVHLMEWATAEESEKK